MINKEALYSKVEELEKELEKQSSAYDYEKTFDEKWKDITLEVFQSTLGEPPRDRNKKKPFKANLDG